MLLACGLFKKDKKKVVFNEEFYECMPDHFKALYDDENGDTVSHTVKDFRLRKKDAPIKQESIRAEPQQSEADNDENHTPNPDIVKLYGPGLSKDEYTQKLMKDTKSIADSHKAIEERVRQKVANM